MSGPKIAILGEAWGEEEEKLGFPFVGSAGRELLNMLDEASVLAAPGGWMDPGRMREFWLTQERVSLHNVFNFRPVKNDITSICVPKAQDRSGLPSLQAGKYLDARYLPELTRLANELNALRPNITICLGNTASWALLGTAGISKIRGTVAAASRVVPGFKVLPTYHPAAVLRQWDLRPVTILDLGKAAREADFPEVRLPRRTVYIEPDLNDLEWFYEKHIAGCKLLSTDIETAGDQVTCIGFAPSTSVSLVVPFVDHRRGGNYWATVEDERRAWRFVRRVLTSPIPKLFQNGIYDMHFLWRRCGIAVKNAEHDTMLLHHSLYPESEKGLGFLGSVYTNEASWKLMRSSTIKRDQ
jgi:uracil-DNA glycosylase